jgi:hypothetical protein
VLGVGVLTLPWLLPVLLMPWVLGWCGAVIKTSAVGHGAAIAKRFDAFQRNNVSINHSQSAHGRVLPHNCTALPPCRGGSIYASSATSSYEVVAINQVSRPAGLSGQAPSPWSGYGCCMAFLLGAYKCWWAGKLLNCFSGRPD